MLQTVLSFVLLLLLAVLVLIWLFAKAAKSGFLKVLLSGGVLAAVVFVGLFMWDLWSYKQALKEDTIAEVWVKKLDERYFLLSLKPVDGKLSQWHLLGDQWQLDVRLLTWRGPLLTLGKQPLYRLDRLSGRYADIELERSQKRSVYALNTSSGMDLWRLAQFYQTWLHANYGGSVFMPLADGAHYLVKLGARGVSVKANNIQAKQAIDTNW